jgi:hypothetical protein
VQRVFLREIKNQVMKMAGTTASSRLERWMPGVLMIRHYESPWLPKDLAAGITLGAVMVPVGYDSNGSAPIFPTLT